MKTLILTISGTATGLGISALCVIGGLQSPRYFGTLATILGVTGASSALVGDWSVRRIKKGDRTYTRDQLEQAIGAIRERNALMPNSISVLVALEEFRSELYGGEK